MKRSERVIGGARDRRSHLQIEGFPRGKVSCRNVGAGLGRGSLLTVSALLLMGLTPVDAQSRSSRPAWTDRMASNPALSAQTSIERSLERFWNLLEGSVASSEPSDRPLSKKRSTEIRSARRGVSIEQKRDTKERRGFIGINLFNLIPLIDIVHGVVDEESVDHVEGRK